jgi:hypothetical protein
MASSFLKEKKTHEIQMDTLFLETFMDQRIYRTKERNVGERKNNKKKKEGSGSILSIHKASG